MNVGPLPGHMLIATESRAGRARSSSSADQPAIRYSMEGNSGELVESEAASVVRLGAQEGRAADWGRANRKETKYS